MGKSVKCQSWPCTYINCGKVFGRKGDLTRHQRLHEGIRLHECVVCLKRFSQASGLTTHENTHSGKKPFFCGLGNCKAAFGDPSSRARHRKETHGRMPPYRCSIPGCKSSIKRRSAFTAHLKKHEINLVKIETETMAPPLLSVPALRRGDTRSIINYDFQMMGLAEEQKFLEQNREEYYAQHCNYNEPWFSDTHQRPMDLPRMLSGDFPTEGPPLDWAWDLGIDYSTSTTDSKPEFTESHSPHSPLVHNAIGSPSASTSSSSPQLSPFPKIESPTTSTVELAGTQTDNAQAALGYLYMPDPNAYMWKGRSCYQFDQKRFVNSSHLVHHQHKDLFTRIRNPPWAF